MDLIIELSKRQIVNLYLEDFRNGKIEAEDLDKKLSRILQVIYEDGRQMGMVEALNYVENDKDRERLFDAIDLFEESLKNES